MNEIKVELNKIFIVQKGDEIKRWKVIEHPYFEKCLTLVHDYETIYGRMKNGICKKDYDHMCGLTTLETAYEDAYLMS